MLCHSGVFEIRKAPLTTETRVVKSLPAVLMTELQQSTQRSRGQCRTETVSTGCCKKKTVKNKVVKYAHNTLETFNDKNDEFLTQSLMKLLPRFTTVSDQYSFFIYSFGYEYLLTYTCIYKYIYLYSWLFYISAVLLPNVD